MHCSRDQLHSTAPGKLTTALNQPHHIELGPKRHPALCTRPQLSAPCKPGTAPMTGRGRAQVPRTSLCKLPTCHTGHAPGQRRRQALGHQRSRHDRHVPRGIEGALQLVNQVAAVLALPLQLPGHLRARCMSGPGLCDVGLGAVPASHGEATCKPREPTRSKLHQCGTWWLVLLRCLGHVVCISAGVPETVAGR